MLSFIAVLEPLDIHYQPLESQSEIPCYCCESIPDHIPGKSGMVLRVVAMSRMRVLATARPIIAANVAMR